MPSNLAATHTTLLLMSFATLLLTPTARGQVEVQFKIKNPNAGPNSTTIDSNALSDLIKKEGATIQFTGISQKVDTFLNAQECPKGTFSESTSDGSQICQKCPAGTASLNPGASSIAACIPCSAGSFSLEKAAECTDCAANTFSFIQAAPAPSYCLRCPRNTTSPVHSSSVQMCICDPGFFLSDNLMHAYPYDAAPITLSLAGIASINIPHVSC